MQIFSKFSKTANIFVMKRVTFFKYFDTELQTVSACRTIKKVISSSFPSSHKNIFLSHQV